jgi:hypothetical protein
MTPKGQMNEERPIVAARAARVAGSVAMTSRDGTMTVSGGTGAPGRCSTIATRRRRVAIRVASVFRRP